MSATTVRDALRKRLEEEKKKIQVDCFGSSSSVPRQYSVWHRTGYGQLHDGIDTMKFLQRSKPPVEISLTDECLAEIGPVPEFQAY